MSQLTTFATWLPLAELGLVAGGWNALLAAFVWRRHRVTLDRDRVDAPRTPVALRPRPGLR